jgi:heme ABC exporter ATP-binding subunit CcmA
VGALFNLTSAGVSLGGRPVLRDVDLRLEAGQSLGVMGPNGSGKTTLLRLIATLLRPDRGEVEVLGTAVGTPEARLVRNRIALIGHTPALIPELTLFENLEHIARLGGLEVDGIPDRLAMVGLDEAADRRVEASSTGMQRRVEIAALMMRDTTLLLLDEATAGLDPDAVGLIDVVVGRALRAGGGAVIVSHEPGLLASCASVVELTNGRVRQ